MKSEVNIANLIKTSIHSVAIKYLKWVFLLFTFLYALTGIYKVDRNKVAVVTQFGKVIERRVLPGLHYTLPFNTVYKVSVKQIQTHTVDLFASSFATDSPAALFRDKTGINPYIITGDNNIVTIKLLIKYTITDAYNYLFIMKKSEKSILPLVSSALIRIFVTQTIDSVLTHGRKQIEQQTKQMLQQKLDALQTGLSVAFVEIQEIEPPQRVKNYFNDVINARMDHRKMINEARAYKNESVPMARTRANRAISSAEAAASAAVLHAQGDTEAFLATLSEYNKDKKSARTRYYLDFIKKISENVKEIRIIQGKQQ